MTIAFKLLRLARPNLRIATHLLLDLFEGWPQKPESYDESHYAHRVQLQDPTDASGLSPALVLPSTFTRATLYLGEVSRAPHRRASAVWRYVDIARSCVWQSSV
jgi:hypothetical protein